MSLHYKTDLLKVFHNGHNDELPILLSESICTRRRNTYSLRGKDSLAVPRFETMYMKDSLAHRSSILWNMVGFKKHGIPHLSRKTCISEIKFDTITASSARRRDSDFIFNNCSPKWRWLAVDIYRVAKRQGKYPPLATDTSLSAWPL